MPLGFSGRYAPDRHSPNACFNFSETSLRILTASEPLMKRRIVYVRGVKPLHYQKRVAEGFKVGDKAWISFDGRRALPVIVRDASDEKHYSVEYNGRSMAGEYGLFRDEVRSTPELACLNRVTS